MVRAWPGHKKLQQNAGFIVSLQHWNICIYKRKSNKYYKIAAGNRINTTRKQQESSKK